MAPFEELPAGALAMIVDQLDPAGACRFAATCRATRQAAETRVEQDTAAWDSWQAGVPLEAEEIPEVRLPAVYYFVEPREATQRLDRSLRRLARSTDLQKLEIADLSLSRDRVWLEHQSERLALDLTWDLGGRTGVVQVSKPAGWTLPEEPLPVACTRTKPVYESGWGYVVYIVCTCTHCGRTHQVWAKHPGLARGIDEDLRRPFCQDCSTDSYVMERWGEVEWSPPDFDSEDDSRQQRWGTRASWSTRGLMERWRLDDDSREPYWVTRNRYGDE